MNIYQFKYFNDLNIGQSLNLNFWKYSNQWMQFNVYNVQNVFSDCQNLIIYNLMFSDCPNLNCKFKYHLQLGLIHYIVYSLTFV
jgi:hypothetical protein